MTDTIFALSSGKPPAAIGVIRISGSQAGVVLQTMIGKLPIPRHATLALVRASVEGALLDSALTLWFPGPRTATGEDLAEIHCHGGRAVTAAILRELDRQPGCRLAEPGEFTRRAFENGRIDLNEAEGLSDLLLAETEAQRRAAMAMAQGHFSHKLDAWRNDLLNLSALTEAALDFSDEDDVPGESIENEILRGIADLADDVGCELQRPSAERLRDGIRVVIAGPPNAGKSTLLNRIVGRDAAIVSDIAGTTRDVIDVSVSLSNVAFLLTDTAGLRSDTSDAIEEIGIGRATAAIEAADIVLWLGDPVAAPRRDALRIAAKADISDVRSDYDLRVSAPTGMGIDDLVKELVIRAEQLLPREGEYALHDRQRRLLVEVSACLKGAGLESDMLIVAEALRRARLGIDALTGRAGTEDMLDALFGTFCIGK